MNQPNLLGRFKGLKRKIMTKYLYFIRKYLLNIIYHEPGIVLYVGEETVNKISHALIS